MLQSLLISAHSRIPCNWVSNGRYPHATYQGISSMLILCMLCSRAAYLGHSLMHNLYRNVQDFALPHFAQGTRPEHSCSFHNKIYYITDVLSIMREPVFRPGAPLH